MEEWRTIDGFENYEISSLGNVRSENKDMVRLQHKRNGYLAVNLYNKGMSQLLVHRLVAVAFLQNPDGLPQVNHKDGNKLNNAVENLEWCTAKGNMTHAYATGLSHCWNKGKHGIYTNETLCRMSEAKRGKYFGVRRAINQYALDGTLLNTWPSAVVAEGETGINRRHISMCCKGIKYKKPGGYLWKFAQ